MDEKYNVLYPIFAILFVLCYTFVPLLWHWLS